MKNLFLMFCFGSKQFKPFSKLELMKNPWGGMKDGGTLKYFRRADCVGSFDLFPKTRSPESPARRLRVQEPVHFNALAVDDYGGRGER